MAGDGRALTPADRATIDRALAGGAFAPAEHAFANLWLFRDRHDYRLHDRPVPHLRGTTYDGERHALPLGPIDASVAGALLADVDCLYPIGSEGPVLAASLGLAIDHDPADSDYWYDAGALATLADARTRRQQAAAFAEAMSPVAVPWTPALADESRFVLDGWMTDVARSTRDTDDCECREALEMAGPLGLEGILVRTGQGEPVSFLLASASEDGTARTVHFAKGRRATSGAYPWMFAHYARSSGATWLNFEQDLGKPGFAQAKRAYAPIRHQPKYRLRSQST